MDNRSRVLIVLALGVVVALWVLSDRNDPAAPLATDTGELEQPGMTADAALLEGQGTNIARGAPGGAARPNADPGDSARAGHATAKKLERITLRLRTPGGEPVRLTKVSVTATSKDGTKGKALVWPVQSDGTVELELIPSLVQTLTVRPFSRGRPGVSPALLTWEVGQGSLTALPPIDIKHAHVLMRTVDSRGDPRPDQRVLFRRREQGAPDPGWFGQRSDDEGWLELGPFPIGARVEMRPGWRGQRGKDLAATPDKWVEIFAGAEPGELFVGDQPRLVLTFTDRGDEKELPITVFDPATGARAFPTVTVPVTEDPEQSWRAPSLKEGKPYEVVVGPTHGGLFARIELEEIPYLDVPVQLTPGVQVEGRVRSVPDYELRAGVINATGRGFRLTAMFTGDGRFRFAGLPEGESVRLHVTAQTKGPNDVKMHLNVTYDWSNETWLDLQLDEPKPLTLDPVYKVPKSATVKKEPYYERSGEGR